MGNVFRLIRAILTARWLGRFLEKEAKPGERAPPAAEPQPEQESIHGESNEQVTEWAERVLKDKETTSGNQDGYRRALERSLPDEQKAERLEEEIGRGR